VTDFQRDRDRIVHSTAFRRLVYKTQVFLNHEGDLFRTRITHSLEVAQLARSIARAAGQLNEDLVEAIALAHDLGHTPFGHAGQDALNDCMARPRRLRAQPAEPARGRRRSSTAIRCTTAST
jgi:dGTPase